MLLPLRIASAAVQLQCPLASADSAFFRKSRNRQEAANSSDLFSVLDNTEEIIWALPAI